MTHRISVLCDTCEQGIIFRVGIGGEKNQLFSISCPKCKQKIGLELILNKKDPIIVPGINIKHFGARVDKYVNCTETEEQDNFIAINLHAELVYPTKYINEKVLLPSTIVSQKMLAHGMKNGIIEDPLINNTSNGPHVINIFDSLSGDANLRDDWLIIKKALELSNNNCIDLSEKELKKYSNLSSLPQNGKYLENIIFDFLFRFISPNSKLYSKIEDEFEKARILNSSEVDEFVSYYKSEVRNFHIKNYIEIFDEYFSNFKDFNRVLLNNKIELHPEKGSECIICPIDFDKIKMYYGNAYEFFTSHILTLICTNNILSNRKFDQFDSMTLTKYLKDVSKEGKSGPLISNQSFKNFTDILDSKIRNASHHKWFYVDDSNIGKLKYKSGGTGALREISYVDYLYKCNEITMRLAVLFMIDIYLVDS